MTKEFIKTSAWQDLPAVRDLWTREPKRRITAETEDAMTLSTTEATHLFYTIGRGWISQTNPSISIDFDRTFPFANISEKLIPAIHAMIGDEEFENGLGQMVEIAGGYNVLPAVRHPDELKADELDDIAYMATSHFYSALGRAFGLDPLSLVRYFEAVHRQMKSYHSAEMVAATSNASI